MLHTVQRHERSAFRYGLHHNLSAFNLVGIEAVHRLTVSVKDIIGDVHDVINRTQANCLQFILKPFRAFLHRNVAYYDSRITRASLGVFYHYINVQFVIVHRKSFHRRAFQGSFVSVLNQPSIQVTCHTVVRTSIRTVGRNVHFQHIIALDIVIILRQCAWHNVIGQHDNTFMTGTDADFVFGANHSVRFYTPKL